MLDSEQFRTAPRIGRSLRGTLGARQTGRIGRAIAVALGTSTICRRHYGLSLSGVTCVYKRRENLFDDVRQAKQGAGPAIGALARWSA